ncbi:hypothetical protein TGAM01_v210836 [Trichoderma gamsii]|uniref:Uncharacterized protein n=1 Tax=Trichoderma gamsii TaxID=398673 RepID=A0A2P4Z7M6_9HYPO|nr:hypothetical protein TGAM01_v210836 [Trichoderma gamsii]PON20285.1 hypothetical protein TGAM01_v210836 [Trichoderma gamsii]
MHYSSAPERCHSSFLNLYPPMLPGSLASQGIRSQSPTWSMLSRFAEWTGIQLQRNIASDLSHSAKRLSAGEC